MSCDGTLIDRSLSEVTRDLEFMAAMRRIWRDLKKKFRALVRSVRQTKVHMSRVRSGPILRHQLLHSWRRMIMTRTKLGTLFGVSALALSIFSMGTVPVEAKNGDLVLRCKARGQNHIAFHARYEERARTKGLRQKFNAEFEARAGGAFTSGQQISIIVDTVTVGTVVLTPAPSGELSGELQFDSKVGNGHTVFPSNFPDVGAGSTVEAAFGSNTILGCDLQ
jgi:hypothetical protein